MRGRLFSTWTLWTLAFILSSTPSWARGGARPIVPDQLVLRIDPQSVPSQEERGRLETFLEEILKSLPSKIRRTLNREVTLRFEALDGAPGVFIPPCVGMEPDANWEPQTLGRVSHSPFSSRRKIQELTLHQGFRAEILSGPGTARTYSCGHKNLYRLALATAIHEIGHLYDFADPRTPEEEDALRECDRPSQDGDSNLCRELRVRHTISTRKPFLDLMGFVETGVIFKSRKQANQSPLRSPDPYEFENPKESFAVNLEYFALDPEFACRRPAVHRFLRTHFEEDPHPNRGCSVNTLIPLHTGIVGSASLLADLNPNRIYQVHALFAGKGPATMSRWGHSLYRIIVCSPEREKPGPECLNDLAHHVAISFRANVPDAAISYYKGLMGGYSSLLFAQPFLSVIEEYNKGEFRELVSLPLALTEDQKTLLIERVLEASWEYTGRYKFISNNCATEALNFLKGVLGEGPISRHHPASPVGLHELLQKLKITDPQLIADIDTAVRSGYYFASKKPEVDGAYQGIRDALNASCGKECLKVLPKDSEKYLQETDAAGRMALYESLWEKPELSRRVMGARFFLLESYVLRRLEMNTLKTISAAIEGDREELIRAPHRASLARIRTSMERLRALQQKKLPTQIQSDGYGIPLPIEDQSSHTDSSPQEEKQLAEEVLNWAKEAFADSFAEIGAATRNRLFFLKEMRKKDPEPGLEQVP